MIHYYKKKRKEEKKKKRKRTPLKLYVGRDQLMIPILGIDWTEAWNGEWSGIHSRPPDRIEMNK